MKHNIYLILFIIISIIVGIFLYKYLNNKYKVPVRTLDINDKKLPSSSIVKIINKSLDDKNIINEIQNQYEAFKLGVSPEILDIFECEGKTYIVMDSLDQTFFNYFSTYIPKIKKEMKMDKFLNLFEEISNKVKDKARILNKNGILHNDLHANNIMFKLDKNNNITDIKIIDFSRSKKGNEEEIFTFYDKWIPFIYKIILSSILINKFNTPAEYEEWKNKNENLIIGYVEDLIKKDPNFEKNFTVLIPDNTQPYPYSNWAVNCGYENICSVFSIIDGIYPYKISLDESKKFFTFMMDLLGANLDDFTVEDILQNVPEGNFENIVPVNYFNNKFYKEKIYENIRRLNQNGIEDESFGYINDCKSKVIRRKIIDKPLYTNCDWTNLNEKALGKGVDGEVWLVKCNKM